MTLLLVGFNHRTAPVELREKLVLAEDSLQPALDKLKIPYLVSESFQNGHAFMPVQEGAILSTCNRFEVYAFVDNRETGWRHLDAFLAGLPGIDLNAINPHLYRFEGMDAASHLMRVAAGLDSMIVGEPQILGQVIQALNSAQATGLSGPIISHLFSQAIHAGKRARSETGISRYTTSVSHAGALMLLDKISVPSPNVLVVGAGEMAILAAKALQRHQVTNLAVINRSYGHAESLASELGAKALSWQDFSEALIWADAVISATDAPHNIIYARDIERILPQRQGRNLVFVDIAVPRDVEVAAGDIQGVQRYDIDDLQTLVDSNTVQRQSAIPQVETIIEQELSAFAEWYHSREVVSVIKDLREWANEVARIEVDQALNKLQDADEHTEEVVNRLAHRLVNKLLHKPTVQLRGQAAEGNGHGYAHAVSELFDLRPTE